jgi:diphthamide biosynthesis enzyme Dph1/Dph2-like protein
MKVLYLEAKSKTKPEEYFIDPNFIKTLPKEIFLCYSIQNKGQAEVMKKALEANKIAVRGFQQVLGCSKLKTEFPIVLIGQGRFHAYNLALQSKHPLLLYSNGSSLVIGERELADLKKKKQASLSKFLASDRIGLLVSTKPGQENIELAIDLKKKITKKYPDKTVFILLSNNINISEFENFDIEFFINTACPGLLNDTAKIANTDDIIAFL